MVKSERKHMVGQLSDMSRGLPCPPPAQACHAPPAPALLAGAVDEKLFCAQRQEGRQGSVICFSCECSNFHSFQPSENIFWREERKQNSSGREGLAWKEP